MSYVAFLSPAEYLGDAAIADLEYPADITGPGPAVRQLHDLLPGGVGQRPAGHEHPAQLVHAAVPLSSLLKLARHAVNFHSSM